MLNNLKVDLHYCPLTGIFTWLTSNSNRIKVGEIAGHLSKYGYVTIRYMGVLYPAHRLAWLYMTGSFPIDDIDHKDTNKSNNKWKNLRIATRSQNNMNSKIRVDNSSGHRGVSKFKDKWRARSAIKGKEKHLGVFDSIEDANKAYEDFVNKLHGEFNYKQ